MVRPRVFYVMIPSIHYYGQSIPKGGSGMLSESMRSYVEANEGHGHDRRHRQKVLRQGHKECIGVRLEDGTEILSGQRGVVSSLDPYQTLLHGFEEGVLSEDILSLVRHFQFGEITIARVHYALHEAPRSRTARI